jgi:hypothetical protein
MFAAKTHRNERRQTADNYVGGVDYNPFLLDICCRDEFGGFHISL